MILILALSLLLLLLLLSLISHMYIKYIVINQRRAPPMQINSNNLILKEESLYAVSLVRQRGNIS